MGTVKAGKSTKNSMKKTTIELPDDLMKRVKLRALRDGKKLKDTVTDLLKAGLSPSSVAPRALQRPVLTKDPKTGLPLIKCPRRPAVDEASPDRVAQILIDQEAEWARESA